MTELPSHQAAVTSTGYKRRRLSKPLHHPTTSQLAPLVEVRAWQASDLLISGLLLLATFMYEELNKTFPVMGNPIPTLYYLHVTNSRGLPFESAQSAKRRYQLLELCKRQNSIFEKWPLVSHEELHRTQRWAEMAIWGLPSSINPSGNESLHTALSQSRLELEAIQPRPDAGEPGANPFLFDDNFDDGSMVDGEQVLRSSDAVIDDLAFDAGTVFDPPVLLDMEELYNVSGTSTSTTGNFSLMQTAPETGDQVISSKGKEPAHDSAYETGSTVQSGQSLEYQW
jgi:hypothetical protein